MEDRYEMPVQYKHVTEQPYLFREGWSRYSRKVLMRK
jgi:hypothetical protein